MSATSRQACPLLLFLSCIVMGSGSNVFELTADNFRGHAGRFNFHPVQGHSNAMVLFYDSVTSPVMLSEYQVVGRAVAARNLGSKVMVGQLRADTDENKAMVERFQLKTFPFVAWLTQGQKEWSGRPIGRAQDLLKGLSINLKLDAELQFAPDEKQVIEMEADNFRGDAGFFLSHPVRGHRHALLMFYNATTSAGLHSEYQVVARTLAHLDLAKKVMVARLNVSVEENKVMVERFDLQYIPFIAWLKKGQQDWWGVFERRAEDVVAQVHEKLNISLKPARNFFDEL